MIRRPPRSTHCISSAASDVYKRQYQRRVHGEKKINQQELRQFRFHQKKFMQQQSLELKKDDVDQIDSNQEESADDSEYEKSQVKLLDALHSSETGVEAYYAKQLYQLVYRRFDNSNCNKMQNISARYFSGLFYNIQQLSQKDQVINLFNIVKEQNNNCLLYTSPSPRDQA
eukprot:TRINITY_DN20501_c0_g1_i1.p1 TRINITY_DN20501_c0_g1~~TRINITY_DN20501_c0_g1_i1.p1  ORF type:complete len:171 (-),score=47.50 TRINITY_DN20501_c0_g1_i1:105-617(-)